MFRLLEQLSVDPLDIHLHAVRKSAMRQCFIQRLICVGKANIFADNANGDFTFGVLLAFNDIIPAGKIRLTV